MAEPITPKLKWFKYTEEHEPAFRDFCCGHDGEWTDDLNDHLPKYAIDEGKEGLNTTYVFYENVEGGAGVAYVTVCCSSIPNKLRDKATNEPIEESAIVEGLDYPNLPVVLIGRIAVRTGYQGCGYGSIILDWVKAMVLDLPLGCRFIAVHVQKKNKKAISFYGHELFFPAKSRQKTLWLYDVSESAALLMEKEEPPPGSEGG